MAEHALSSPFRGFEQVAASLGARMAEDAGSDNAHALAPIQVPWSQSRVGSAKYPVGDNALFGRLLVGRLLVGHLVTADCR